jgi:DNA-directed RNA polymerase subunit beta'
MRTFHIGGVVKREIVDSDVKAKKAGVVRFDRIKDVINDKQERIALSRNGEVSIVDPKNKDKVLESYAVPNGAVLYVEAGMTIAVGTLLCKWDPHITPIIAEVTGKVRYDEITEDFTLRKERDKDTGAERWVIMEHKGDLHPQILLEDERGQILMSYYMPEKAFLEVREGQKVSSGSLLAKTPREESGTQDITGGLPRVTEIFEARTPRDPAKMAEVSGKVRLGERKRGKRLIYVQPIDDDQKSIGEEREHQVPPGKHLRVRTGDIVKEGDRLVYGPLVPHEILKISGPEEVQKYLVSEVQAVYRAQRVEIDDKHIEIIVSQMLRKVKIEEMGDTGLLPGSVIDKFGFREVNERLKKCVKIKNAGGSKFEEGKIVTKEVFEEERTRLEAEDKTLPTFTQPEAARCSTQLLGITKAAVQSDSFISAASFQETTKVLTEAALAGKVDYLVGLKENVILGHLVPAGTGFKMHQEAEVRLNAPQAERRAEAAAEDSGELATAGKS